VAQLKVIYEAPTMDNGASSILLQLAERSGLCYAALHIATDQYAHNTGNNLYVSRWPCNGRLVRVQARVRSQSNSCEESGSGTGFVHPLSMSFHHCRMHIHFSSRGWTMGLASVTVSH
jgi:hypothetical protein